MPALSKVSPFDPTAVANWFDATFLDTSTAAVESSPSFGPVTVGAAALTDALYLTEAGDTAAISMNDIHQGQMRDCFVVSCLGDLANTHPDFLANMIQDNGDGTETVTLYQSASGTIPTAGQTQFQAIAVTVDNNFASYSVNSGAGQDQVDSQKEIWAQVLEKAIATTRGGYSAIAYGGNPTSVMEQLTGHTANYYSAASMTADMLRSFSAAGDLITFDTMSKSTLGYGLVGSHAYEFVGVVDTASGPAVQLKNPWGYSDPSLIPVSQLSKNFAEVDVGRFA